jgi:hypothetical protein
MTATNRSGHWLSSTLVRIKGGKRIGVEQRTKVQKRRRVSGQEAGIFIGLPAIIEEKKG